jgi:transcriptional regulator with XRE-family HTH domain
MTEFIAFFPPPLTFYLVSWRERLRTAIAKSGMKHSIVALDAGITPETLSRILSAEHQRPGLDTITRIAHAVNENVGWILDEQGFALSADETRQLREVVTFLQTTLLNAPLPRVQLSPQPNALPVATRRRDIPGPFAARGARMTYQLTDDSLRDIGIVDGDLIYVRPSSELRAAAGQLIVCDVTGEPFVKKLDLKSGRIRLLSHSDRYTPLEVYEHEIEMIGVVVGRVGAVGREGGKDEG